MRIAIVAVFGLLASVVTSQFALAQTTDCAGISKREQLIRLKAASNYALLPVIYPDNSVHEVVLYGAAAPYVLTQVGVLSRQDPFIPSRLTDSEVEELASQPIRFTRKLGHMESDLAPGEKCAMGGEATVSSDDRLWGASWTVDEILRRFFEFNYLSKDGTERYVLRKEFALRLACADIADLLRHHLQVERAGSFGSLVVIREAPENVPRDALDRNEAS